MTVTTIFYGPGSRELGRVTYQLSDLVQVHAGTLDCRTFPADVAPPPPSSVPS